MVIWQAKNDVHQQTSYVVLCNISLANKKKNNLMKSFEPPQERKRGEINSAEFVRQQHAMQDLATITASSY